MLKYVYEYMLYILERIGGNQLIMEIELRKMTAAEYAEFYEWSFNNHVKELVRDTNISTEEAIKQTVTEVQDMLPDGIDTEDNYLMTIVDSLNKKSIGFIWYLYEKTDGIQQSFLCDFFINEPERLNGYASKALTSMEHNASGYGCQESFLFVAKENEAARNLYAKCGYSFLRELDEGMYLKKKL